jgi:hypothetical protein
MFYERSSGEPHPGKGAGEINVGDVKDVELSTKPFHDWRRKLDSWKKSPFSINGKRMRR